MAKTRRDAAGEIVAALAHPLRPQIVAMCANERRSPVSLADELGAPLPNISYHVRVLTQAGLLKRAGRRDVRGAIEHFYVVDADARLAAATVLRETADAIEQGTVTEHG
jgi:DNA-binding transcriptional ArsR family regulator